MMSNSTSTRVTSNPLDAEIGPAVSALRRQVLERLSTFQHSLGERTVDTPQGPWRYRETGGSGGASVTLALPGIQGGGDIFFDLARENGAILPLVCATAPDIEDVATMTASTAAFLDALGAARVNLLGASLGGYLVQAFAAAHPERVDQMIVSNGFYDPAPFLVKMPSADELKAAPAATLVEKGMEPMLDLPDDDAGHIALKTVMQALVGSVQSPEGYKSRMVLLTSCGALLPPDLPADRIMLIDDDEDPMVPPVMRNALRERFRDSEQHAILGGGHLPVIQRPHEFATLIRKRLNG